jgi:hypothetical protein
VRCLLGIDSSKFTSICVFFVGSAFDLEERTRVRERVAVILQFLGW